MPIDMSWNRKSTLDAIQLCFTCDKPCVWGSEQTMARLAVEHAEMLHATADWPCVDDEVGRQYAEDSAPLTAECGP